MNDQHSPIEWDSDDKLALRKFLNETRTGGRLIPALASGIPGLLGSGDTNAILIRAGEVRGANILLEQLFLLANPPAKETLSDPAPYPSLTDDAAWDDGQKIETPTTE